MEPLPHDAEGFVLKLVHLALVPALVLTGCGQTVKSDHRKGKVIEVAVPSPPGGSAAIETLEPAPTPSPTPIPTPRPTPVPLDPPKGASMKAASGTQKGATSSHCWVYSDGHSTCVDYPVPSQPSALAVRKGESVLITIDVAASPSEEKIRPFQGDSRSGFPEQKIDPATQTSLELALEPGTWNMDVCGTWRGHGEPVCWLFKLEVSA